MKNAISELTLYFNPFPVLTTERLTLRAFLNEDANDLLAMRSDEIVMKYLGKDPMKNLQEAKEYIVKVNKDAKENKTIEWAMTLKQSDRVIGKLGYWRIMQQHRRAELGYTLISEYFGQGIMSEAVKAVLQFGFEEMKLHSVEANLDPKNIKSANLLVRNGFVKEGHARENYFYNGVFTDTGTYGLLHADWVTKNTP